MERAEQSYDFDSLGRDPNKPPGMSGCAKVGIGCGIALVILTIVVGIGAWYVTSHMRELGADLATAALKGALEELKIPDDQEQRIVQRIDDLGQMFKDGKIELEDVGRIVDGITKGPLIAAGMALATERAYLDKSGLDDAEKEVARISIRRFTHGAMRENIPQEEVNSVLDTISTIDAEGTRQFRSPVSDDELRAFIEAAKQAADKNEIPENVPEINFADEFDKAVDRALGIELPDTELPAEAGDSPAVESENSTAETSDEP